MSVVKWLKQELESWKPPLKMSVSDWADMFRILDQMSSAEAGKWKTSRTPYLREPMDAFNDDNIEEIVLCFGAQLGKTEALLNMILYVIEHQPAPTMLLYPIEALAEFASENRITPAIRLIPQITELWRENDSQKLEIKFNHGMFLALAGANSPAKLASKPIKYVFMDEIDKFPGWSGDEASPIALAQERTKTFYGKKIIKVSTPTVNTGNIWLAYQQCDVRKEFSVPCPHCSHYQILKLNNIKCLDAENPKDSAYYECEQCHEMIFDKHKQQMTLAGRWEFTEGNKTKARKVGYHLSSIYSPWITFGEVLDKFLISKAYPELLMNFINSWLAEPWVNQASKIDPNVIYEKQTEHLRKYVPEKTIALTAGVDVQKTHLYYTVRAWGNNMTSWLVDYGRVETLEELRRKLIDTPYPVENDGGNRFIDKIAVDSGYESDKIYDFCHYHSNVCIPVKGSSQRQEQKYKIRSLDDKGKHGLKLYLVDTYKYKDFIFGRIKMPVEVIGSWNVCVDIEAEYADQITAEQKVQIINKRTGQHREEWQKITSHAANHYLDCEVYATVAADVYDVRDLYTVYQMREELRQNRPPEEEQPKEQPKKEPFIKRRTSNWLQR